MCVFCHANIGALDDGKRTISKRAIDVQSQPKTQLNHLLKESEASARLSLAGCEAVFFFLPFASMIRFLFFST